MTRTQDTTHDRPSLARPPLTRPLAGKLIVEAVAPEAPEALTCAAGLCGRMAADLGARVVRLTVASDPSSPTHLFLHGGKEAIRVAPADFAGLAARLASGADALLVDHAGHGRIAPPSEVVTVVIGMSRDAPDTGSELTIEARAGLLDLVGDPEREPLRLAGHQVAYSAGLAAYLGLVSALTRRGAGLPAGPVVVDLLDVGVWLNWKALSMAARTGESPSRPGAMAEWIIVPCADGHVALVYRLQEWKSLKAATGDARLDDPRFESPAARRRNREPLNIILREIFAGMTRAEIRDMALANKLPLGPVWTPNELRSDPHMRARRYFQNVAIDGHCVAMPSLPVQWNGQAFPPAIVPFPAQPTMDVAG